MLESSCRFLLILLLVHVYCVCSSASEIRYRKVVDTDSQLPVVSGTWSGFYNPAISNGNVAFLAYQPVYSPLSLFAESGGAIKHIASNMNTVPGDGRKIIANFSTTSYPLYHKGNIYWEVSLQSAAGSTSGVLEYSHSGLRVAFDESSVNAHAGRTLSWYAYHSIAIGHQGQVVRALNSSDNKLWLIGYNGTELTTINAGTSMPPSTTFFTQKYAVYNEGFAIYQPNTYPSFSRDHRGNLQNLDIGLTAFLHPETNFSTHAVYGNGRWFAVQCVLTTNGSSTMKTAILGWAAGKWFNVVREGDLAQDNTTITSLSDISSSRYSLNGDSLLFTAGTSSGDALFLFRNGIIHRILSRGDLIDNKEVVSILIGRNSFEGDLFTFVVHFNNGKRAVYVGDLSDKYPTTNSFIDNKITLTGPHTGVVYAPTANGKVYHLLETDDLRNWAVHSSLQGDSSVKHFLFNNQVEAPQRKFYTIDEATYSK